MGPTCTWDHMAKETQKHKYQFDKIDFPSQGLSSTIAAFWPDEKTATSLAQGVPSLSHHPVVQLNMQTQNSDTSSSWTTNQIKSQIISEFRPSQPIKEVKATSVLDKVQDGFSALKIFS